MAIRFFDMFAGIGGFRSGLEAVGGFKCVGHCEIDKYANQAYNAIYDTEGEVFFADARNSDPGTLPDLDLVFAALPYNPQKLSVYAGYGAPFEPLSLVLSLVSSK